MIIATCVVKVPSLVGGYAPFDLSAPELIGLAIDHINRGDVALIDHPVYQHSSVAFTNTIIDLAVEILNHLPAELETDFDQIGIVQIDGTVALVTLEMKD